MKKKINKKSVIFTMLSLFTLASSLSLLIYKKMPSKEIISSNEVEVSKFCFEQNKIKLKNIGDTYTLNVLINEDATYQSCRFIISDETALKMISKTNNSITFKRIKDFEDYVTIKAISDDPFLSLEDTCYVRCYNNLKSIDYLNVVSITDSKNSYDSLKKLCKEDKVILKQGLTYKCSLVLTSLFSYLNGEETYEGDTELLIEYSDMSIIKTSLENVFNNTLITFDQDLSEYESNRIVFSFTYTNKLSISSSLYKNIEVDNLSLEIELKNYVETNSFGFSENNVVI